MRIIRLFLLSTYPFLSWGQTDTTKLVRPLKFNIYKSLNLLARNLLNRYCGMKRVKWLFTFSFALMVIRVMSQSGYAVTYIDFKASPNSSLLHENTDNLGSLLVEGYLKGKLRGYKFAYNEEILKWAPMPAKYWPGKWDPKKYYFLDDRVSYKGYGYEMIEEIGPSSTPPDQSTKWVKQILKGEVVSRRYSFPSVRDTLSKADFLKNMVENQRQLDKWNPYAGYYMGDEVEYEGRKYMSIGDTPHGNNPTNDKYWEPSGTLIPMFSSLDDLTGIEILSYYEIKGDTTWYPQVISLHRYNDYVGSYDRTVVSFFFPEAIQYLNSISQPIVYQAKFGYMGNSMLILGQKEKTELAKWINKKLTLNQLTLTGTKIIDNQRLQLFLKDTANLQGKYGVAQDLLTQNPVIHDTHPIYTIPLASIALLLEANLAPPPNPLNYSQALLSNVFYGQTSVTEIDSLIPDKHKNIASNQALEYFFLEEYSLSWKDAGERANQVKAWQQVAIDFKNKSLTPMERHFNYVAHDWSKEGNWSSLGKDLSKKEWVNLLNHYDSDQGDLLEIEPHDSTTLVCLAPVYKKYLRSSLKSNLEPVEITFYGSWIGNIHSVSFSWKLVKESLLKTNPSGFSKLIESIEKGQILIRGTKIVSGLREVDK